MTDSDKPTPTPKASKKSPESVPLEPVPVVPRKPAPALTFEEFALVAGLAPVRVSGLETHLRATSGLAPRLLTEWQAALTNYQALA